MLEYESRSFVRALCFCWDSPPTKGKKRKLSEAKSETPSTEEPPKKKFKFDTNPNLHKTLFARHISNLKRVKTKNKYDSVFKKQYRSEKISEALISDLYQQGRQLNIYTNLTESGCMVLRGRSFNCWCKDHMQKLKDIERQKKMEEINQQKKKAILAMAKKLNNKITHSKIQKTPKPRTKEKPKVVAKASPSAGKKSPKSRWGPWEKHVIP